MMADSNYSRYCLSTFKDINDFPLKLKCGLAGFHYDRTKDTVQCYFCKLSIARTEISKLYIDTHHCSNKEHYIKMNTKSPALQHTNEDEDLISIEGTSATHKVLCVSDIMQEAIDLITDRDTITFYDQVTFCRYLDLSEVDDFIRCVE